MFQRVRQNADQGIHPGLSRPEGPGGDLRDPLLPGAGDRLRRDHRREARGPAVYDLDNSVTSRELTARFVKSGYFRHRRFSQRPHPAGCDDRPERGHRRAAHDHGFAADLRAGRTAQVQLILDGTDSNTAGIVLSYAGKIAEEYSRQVLVSRYQKIAGSGGPCRGRSTCGAGPGSTTTWTAALYVPGVIVIVVTLVTLPDQPGHRAGEGDRPMEQIHGHADYAGRVHSRQDRAFRPDRFSWTFSGGDDRHLLVRRPMRGSMALLFGGTALY